MVKNKFLLGFLTTILGIVIGMYLMIIIFEIKENNDSKTYNAEYYRNVADDVNYDDLEDKIKKWASWGYYDITYMKKLSKEKIEELESRGFEVIDDTNWQGKFDFGYTIKWKK